MSRGRSSRSRSRSRSRSTRRPFIKKAVKEPGALRATVKQRYGKKGFTKRGTIRQDTLAQLSKEPGRTGRRARFAKNVLIPAARKYPKRSGETDGHVPHMAAVG